MAESIPSSDPISQLRSVQFERVLNQDTRTKTITWLGSLSSQPVIVLAEKTAFQPDSNFLAHTTSPSSITLLESNDIYHWFLASHTSDASSVGNPRWADMKLTMIYPATETHIRKYSQQNLRVVTETPEIYREHVKPYVEEKRGDGRLNWVYNILEKKAESDRIIFEDPDKEHGFLLLPDSKWDRKTLSSLYTLVLVNRRDITSIRDLKKKHAPWLRRIQKAITAGICKAYEGLEEDQLRLYVHYQPSYYHFHIHAVSLAHDAGGGMAAGKAILLSNIISQLEIMAGNDEDGFESVELTYTLGEESELWQRVFSKLKKGQ